MIRVFVASVLALSLTACDFAYEEVSGRVVDKRHDTGSVPVGDVTVPVDTYLLQVLPSDGGKPDWHTVDYTSYRECEVDQRFYQDVEGLITCKNG